jgi:hypothetical protein
MAGMSSKKGGHKFLFTIIGAGLLAGAIFVPIRTCERCHGIAGVKVGDVVDLRCNGCGGKGKQTVLDIGIAAVRK